MSKELTQRQVLSAILKAPAKSELVADSMMRLKLDYFSVGTDYYNLFGWLQNKFMKGESIEDVDLVIDKDFGKFSILIGSIRDEAAALSNLPKFTSYLESYAKASSLKNYHQSCIDILNSEISASDSVSGALSMPQPNMFDDSYQSDRTLNDIVAEFMDDFDKPFVPGEQTGLENLDKILNENGKGVASGSLIVIFGGTKHGKSTVASTIFANRLSKTKASLCFTMEISGLDFISNVIAQIGKVGRGHIIRRDKGIINKLSEVASELHDKHAFIDDKSGMSLEHIILKSRMHARKMPVKTILVDYLTLIRTPNGVKRDHNAYGDMVTSLRQLAKELNCIVIIVSQMTKEAMKRLEHPGARPEQTDVRDTAQLSYDCHLMLGVYSNTATLENRPRQMEVEVLLNRNGAPGGVAYFDFEEGNITPKSIEKGRVYASLLEEMNKKYR
jgi:replicative DNA helicase